MKNLKNNIIIKNIFIVMMTIAISTSCSKKEEKIVEIGKAEVNIQLSGIDEEQKKIGSKGPIDNSINDLQSGVIDYSDGCIIAYDIVSDNKQSISSSKLHSNDIKSLKAASTITELKPNTRFRVLAYDDQKVLKADVTYSYGVSAAPMVLDAGKTYTFIAYSINKTDALPDVLDETNMTTAKLTSINEDLMFVKKDQLLTYGSNSLQLTLKHMFSSIVSNFSIDANTPGAFQVLSNPRVGTTHPSATLNFINSSLDYNGTNTGFKSLIWNDPFTGGVRSVSTSISPNLLISPTSNTGSIIFDQVQIDSESKPISINNLNIVPGVRYTLNMIFKTCTKPAGPVENLDREFEQWNDSRGRKIGAIDKNVTPWVTYRDGTTIEREIIAPPANFGFVFNIYELDNTFNMKLNNTLMAAQEIQFQKLSSTPQNIRFVDGARYGYEVPEIYHMTGTELNPLLKIMISKDGVVRIFGSKYSGGPLHELELFNNNYFNPFPWDSTQSNVILLTQIVDGITIMKGAGSGLIKISCANGN